ncbi:hypothetical protein CBR_g20222 [Chara braunii]|uniref:Uncharacterized protein n=1 Tax=Chara braunii TaxID=69332 RepID=A0A388KZY5_CHABU|nr:hypothetical protein CBR_g20222 [Chara braunii]|eukprot:GBG75591.1 hypothetical protein CBR_g20222 [Chara braunii]
MKSEGDKATTEKGKVDDRDLRKFHLTSVYDEQGTDWVGSDKKVSLDLALFKGYGQTPFGLLVPYDTPVQGVAGVLKSCGEARQVPSTSQEHSDVVQKVITYSKRSGAGSSDKPAKRNQLATPPPQLQGPAATTGTSRSRQTDLQAIDQRSEEQTEMEEDVGFRGRDVGFLEDSRHEGAVGDIEGNVELEQRTGGSERCGDDCSDEEQDTEYGGSGRREEESFAGGMECEMGASSGGPHNDREQSDRMQNEDVEDDGGDDDVETGGASKVRGKRKANASLTPAAMKKQARKEVVDDARCALDASQETLGEAAKKRKEGSRIRKTSQPKRVARSSRLPKSDDSSDDAEGVGPRRPDLIAEDETEMKRPRAVNMTRCFFLEYDEDERKRKDVPRVCIDVMSILPIPEGEITFNQWSLNKAIVAGLDTAIDRFTAQRGVDDDALWEPPELILAPITPCADDPNFQGTRVLPQDFDWRRAKEYFYYPVARQYTSEAMKRVARRGSPARL